MASVSQSTKRQLYLQSCNKCAFPGCGRLLVDPESGVFVGEICHINGQNPGSARYDVSQIDQDRNSVDNLILLCGTHHTIVDKDVATYTKDRLVEMKLKHESASIQENDGLEKGNRHVISVTTNSQSGGQTAHQIINNYSNVTLNDEVKIEGQICWDCSVETKERFGCVGLKVSIIGRSSRSAKLKSCNLIIDNVELKKSIQDGFGINFDNAIPTEKQKVEIQLIPISPQNNDNGFVINLDDAYHFFYPLPTFPTNLAMKAKREDVSLSVTFFDNSKQEIVSSNVFFNKLSDLTNAFQHNPGRFNGTLIFSVHVKSSKPPGPEIANAIGKMNENSFVITNNSDGN